MRFHKDPLADPDRLIRRVYAYVAYRIGDISEAEDVTSETFERAVRYRDSYDAAKGEPVAWLLGIARHVIADTARAHKEAIHEVVDPPAPRDVEEDAVRRLGLAAAVAKLDEHDRDLIALRYGSDLSARQIAELLGVRTNTVEVGLHRAVARLRATLEQEASGDSPPPTEKTAGSAVRI